MARLWLGDDWVHPNRCLLFGQSPDVGNWDGVVREAQPEAAKALDAMAVAAPKPGTQ